MTDNSLKNFYARGDSFLKREFHTYAAETNMSPEDIKNLNGKKILLVGGGASPIKKNLSDIGLNCFVTNIDLFYSEKDPDNADVLITDDFLNRHIVDEFDEIWVVYSLPMHSKTEYEWEMFWTRAILALKPGGHLRVTGRLEPKHAKFFQKFNEKFPNTILRLDQIPFVWKLEDAKITNKINTDEFIKNLQDAKAAEALSHTKYTKKINYLHFAAPADKSEMDNWLMQNLQKLNMPMITRNMKKVIE